MEKRVNMKVCTYVEDFKDKIKSWVEDSDDIEFDIKSKFLKFIYDFDNINLSKEDFTKRKRVKSIIPQYLRCSAKRANGEQCSRKKREESSFCGTHDKNRPHGEYDIENTNDTSYKKVEVKLQEINGILYYIDNTNNIYSTEDIISNKLNPHVIAKYNVVNDIYSIMN